MNLKNLTLATALVLAIPSLALVSCKKAGQKITVKITADDANTARTWIGDSLVSQTKLDVKNNKAEGETKEGFWLDSFATANKNNKNDAVIEKVEVSYTDKSGNKQNKPFTGAEAQKFVGGVEFADVAVGKEITVVATAKEGGDEGASALKVVESKKTEIEQKLSQNSGTPTLTKKDLAELGGLSKEKNDGKPAEGRVVTLTVDISGVSGSDVSKIDKQEKEVTVTAQGTAQK